jgi:hypothetical protein
MLNFVGPMQQESVSAEYINEIEFNHNPAEIRIRFYRSDMNFPAQQRVLIHEIIMAPIIAKILFRGLGDAIKAFEEQWGTIFLPDDWELVQNLFGIKEAPPAKEPEEPTDEV